MSETNPPDQGLSPIEQLANEMASLHRIEAAECGLLIDELIESGTKDVSRIEHLLDRTLDACAHNSAVPAFKRLCKYYAQFDPVGAEFYVGSYFEMWGE